MGFKSVELQVAIPRSQDAGKMQEQLSKQGQHFQETLAQQKLRKDALQRQRVNKHEKVMKQGDKENPSKQAQDDIKKQEENISEKSSDETHPFLGQQVDFTR